MAVGVCVNVGVVVIVFDMVSVGVTVGVWVKVGLNVEVGVTVFVIATGISSKPRSCAEPCGLASRSMSRVVPLSSPVSWACVSAGSRW